MRGAGRGRGGELEIAVSHVSGRERVDLCHQKTFVSRIPREISSGDEGWQRGAVPRAKVEIIGGKPGWEGGRERDERWKENQAEIDGDGDDDIGSRKRKCGDRAASSTLSKSHRPPATRRSTRAGESTGEHFFGK